MPASTSPFTALLMFILPWPLFLTGILGGFGTDSHFRLIKKLTLGSAWFALGDALFSTTTYLLGSHASNTLFSLPLPWNLGSFALSVDVNTLSVIMMFLVALVGLIVTRYAYTYMEGDAHEGVFHHWLALTLGSFLIVITSGNVWEFFVFWVATSLFLHHLLAFYPDRPLALIAARKKYILHRIADLSLLIALILVVHTLHITAFNQIMPAMTKISSPLPASLEWAGALIALSAVLKSAQVPLHGWLIQVMEAPTPVSALLHAGIIYTGTFLLLRMVAIMSRVVWAQDMLIVIGLISITTASLMMMTATNIKGSLAYSTSAQMGFMLMEFGLGLYALAVLHIISHSVYKAHAFLASGSTVEYFRWPVLPKTASVLSAGKIIASWLLSTVIVILTARFLQIPLLHNLPITVMGVILAIALSQLIYSATNQEKSHVISLLGITVLLSALVATLYFLLDAWFMRLLAVILPKPSMPQGIVPDALLGLIVLAFMSLLLVQQMLPRLLARPLWRAVFVHLYNDLYIDMIFTRWIQRFSPMKKTTSLPATHQAEHPLPEMRLL